MAQIVEGVHHIQVQMENKVVVELYLFWSEKHFK